MNDVLKAGSSALFSEMGGMPDVHDYPYDNTINGKKTPSWPRRKRGRPHTRDIKHADLANGHSAIPPHSDPYNGYSDAANIRSRPPTGWPSANGNGDGNVHIYDLTGGEVDINVGMSSATAERMKSAPSLNYGGPLGSNSESSRFDVAARCQSLGIDFASRSLSRPGVNSSASSSALGSMAPSQGWSSSSGHVPSATPGYSQNTPNLANVPSYQFLLQHLEKRHLKDQYQLQQHRMNRSGDRVAASDIMGKGYHQETNLPHTAPLSLQSYDVLNGVNGGSHDRFTVGTGVSSLYDRQGQGQSVCESEGEGEGEGRSKDGEGQGRSQGKGEVKSGEQGLGRHSSSFPSNIPHAALSSNHLSTMYPDTCRPIATVLPQAGVSSRAGKSDAAIFADVQKMREYQRQQQQQQQQPQQPQQ
jgi:hypothetical protein